MSGIFDQIINYSPPLIVSGTVNYKGTWNASTNNPPLSNPPVASTKGDYYVVSTAGTQFSISFAVGDWIISSGTAWEKVDLTDAVSSVFGRTGAVVGVSTDYSAVGLTNTAIGASSPSTGAFTTVTASSTIAASGTVTGSNLSGTNTGDQTTITGNAGSATILQTARNINGVSFNGSADITVTAAAGTLTGATLASGVTASSLTSLGTIASLVATTADINGGTIDGTAIGATTPSTVAATTIKTSSTASIGTTAVNEIVNIDNATGNAFVRFDKSGTFQGLIGIAQTAGQGSSGSAVGDIIVRSQTNSLIDVAGTTVGKFTTTGLNSTAIGATTPATGAFTTVTASGKVATGGTANTRNLNVGNASSAYTELAIRSSAASTVAGGATIYFANATDDDEGWLNYDNAARTLTTRVARTTVGTWSSTGLAVTGALSSTTGANFATSSGNVGIGTTSPVEKVYVSDGLNEFGINPTTLASPFNAVNGTSLDFRFTANGNTNARFAAIVGALDAGSAGNNSGHLEFWTAPTGSGNPAIVERMRILANGNVGIGTASPGANLQVNRSAQQTDIDNAAQVASFFNTSTDTAGNLTGFRFRQENGTNVAQSFFGLSSTGNAATRASLIFAPPNTSGNATERVRIDSSGNVGIGTTDQFGGGVKVVGLANATTVPASNPTGGGVLYVESGALKFRGSSGTVTTIANA